MHGMLVHFLVSYITMISLRLAVRVFLKRGAEIIAYTQLHGECDLECHGKSDSQLP